jgi:hypothetical protein
LQTLIPLALQKGIFNTSEREMIYSYKEELVFISATFDAGHLDQVQRKGSFGLVPMRGCNCPKEMYKSRAVARTLMVQKKKRCSSKRICFEFQPRVHNLYYRASKQMISHMEIHVSLLSA